MKHLLLFLSVLLITGCGREVKTCAQGFQVGETIINVQFSSQGCTVDSQWTNCQLTSDNNAYFASVVDTAGTSHELSLGQCQ
jgi:hypothetical protein